MRIKLSLLALVCIASLVYSQDVSKDKRQVDKVVNDEKDREVAETGFLAPAAAGHGAKYFQYAHQPHPHHYEHGHKRGNDHHFIERHEKAHPHAGEFKTKVRWGDKHGGYGEHYWDYNHAGHHDGDGEESQQKEEYASYDESVQTPVYQANSDAANRGKRQGDDVEFVNDRARSLYYSGATPKHGGNYRNEPKDYERGKREDKQLNGEDLVFVPESGLVLDQRTGKTYQLNLVKH